MNKILISLRLFAAVTCYAAYDLLKSSPFGAAPLYLEALQYSVAVQNARLDAVESTTGVSALLTIRSGAAPANCAAANSGTVLATINLPSDWMNAASAGAKTKLGTWSEASADATGTAAHFRIHDTGGTNCHIQGTVGTSGTDMIVDSVSFTATQVFTINTFTLNAGNV
jgi:hypothetical protein